MAPSWAASSIERGRELKLALYPPLPAEASVYQNNVSLQPYEYFQKKRLITTKQLFVISILLLTNNWVYERPWW